MELGRQQTKDFDSAKAQRIGKQVGAYGVVVGSLSPKNKAAEAQLRFVKVDTGEILIAVHRSYPTSRLYRLDKSGPRKMGFFV